MQYFGDDGDRMHMMFNFQVNQNLFYALAAADTRPLAKAMKQDRKTPRKRTVGTSSCAITMSSISAGLPRSSGNRFSTRSGRTRKTSYTIAASGGGWRRCWAVTAAGWSSPTA